MTEVKSTTEQKLRNVLDSTDKQLADCEEQNKRLVEEKELRRQQAKSLEKGQSGLKTKLQECQREKEEILEVLLELYEEVLCDTSQSKHFFGACKKAEEILEKYNEE